LDSINVAVSSPCGGAQNCGLDYYKIAESLISEYRIVSFKGISYLYENGTYKQDFGKLDKAIIRTLIQNRLGGKDSFTNPTSQIKYIINGLTSEDEYPFNKQKNLIPVRNGVLRVNNEGSIDLLDHSPDHRFTYLLPIDYNPTADVNPVIEFLNSTGCEKDILLQIPAQGLLSKGGMCYKKAYLLKGVKHTGKTTYLNLLNKKFFGMENCSNVSLHDLISDSHASSALVGKLMNVSNELSRVSLSDLGRFKEMTGGGVMSVNRKYYDPYSIECDTMFVFATNAYPSVVDTDDYAFWERWMIVDFTETHKIDPLFEERTYTDAFLSAFLNLVIERMLQILKEGIKSDSWEIIKAKWLNDGDPFYHFVSTCLERGNEFFIVGADLFAHYEKYCEAMDDFPISVKEFGIKIQELGALHRQKTIGGKPKRGYIGYRIKDQQLS
jgi:putative DNA primase/helicase